MAQVSAQEASKRRKYSVVSNVIIPIWFDGHELFLTQVIYGHEVGVLDKNEEHNKVIYHLWGKLTNRSMTKDSKIHIQYRGGCGQGYVITQTRFKGKVGSQNNQLLAKDIISGWEYYRWGKANCPDLYC
jgi:hypothetical protein